MKTSIVSLSSPAIIAVIAILSCALGLRAADLTWDADTTTPGAQDGAGNWTGLASNTNWWNGVNNVTWDNTTPANAIFGANNGTAAGTVTVPNSTTNTVGSISFAPSASGSYIITVGSSTTSKLNLSGNPTITVSNGVIASINVPMSGTSYTKAGGGTLTNNPGAANINVGPTYVTGGTLVIGGASANRLIVPGDLTVSNGSTAIDASGGITNNGTLSLYQGSTFITGSGKSQALTGVILDDNSTMTESGTETISVGNFDARSGTVVSPGGKLDAVNFTKSTSGTVTLQSQGSSTTTGGLTNIILNAGTLVLDYTQTSSKINNNSGTLTVNGGTLIFTNGSSAQKLLSVTLTNGVITNAFGTESLSAPATGFYDVRNGEIDTVLAGAAALTKTTPDTVVLSAANTYTGGTVVSAGVLQVGNGGLTGAIGSSTVANNSAIVFNLGSGGASTIGGVISGNGTITKIGGGTVSFTPVNNYQGSTTISNGAITIDSDATLGDGTGALNLSGGTLTTTASRSASANPVANPINLTADSAVTTTSTSGSTIDLNFSSSSITTTAGSLTFSNSGSGSGGVFVPRFSGSGFNFSQPIVIANGVNGTTRLDSYNTTGTTQTFSAGISGSGGYRRNASAIHTGGTTVFYGNNIYTGNTDVNQGLLLVNGSIGNSLVSVGVTGSTDGTLGGTGTIAGAVTIGAGGNLAPGAAIGSIGQLTINNSLSLGGNMTVDVNKAGAVFTQDSVAGLTSVTFGGNLIVNATGDALVIGDHFTLFNTGGTGNFATITPDPGAGLAWSFDNTTGILSVVNGAPPTLNVSQSGNTLTFSWTGTFKLQSQTNSLTTGLGSNWFDYPDLSNPVNITIDPANPTVFFRLSQ